MEQFKLGQLISNFDFVVGIMKIIENKTPEAFVTALLDYQKMKNQLVWKSSVRLKIGETEYSYNIKKTEHNAIDNQVNESTLLPDVENEFCVETTSSWEKSLSDNIIKKLIINHYLSIK